MEQLANRGNGNYTFIDSINEARRAVVDRLTSTIMVIAKDVKIQLEVNPLLVKTYRLLGYENRSIADQDFRNDQVDAGEIGAGHTVTALVEVELFNDNERPNSDDLNLIFTDSSIDPSDPNSDEVIGHNENPPSSTESRTDEQSTENRDDDDLTSTVDQSSPLTVDSIFDQSDAPIALLRLRAKAPNANADDVANEYQYILHQEEHQNEIDNASASLRFAVAVAEFAEILRHSPHVHEVNFDQVRQLASSSLVRGDDFMVEFLTLIDQASELWDHRSQR